MEKKLFFKRKEGSIQRSFRWRMLLLVFILTVTGSVHANEVTTDVEGGTLSEDPFHFCVGDGVADHVEKVSVEGASGPYSQWVVTDESGTILGLPPTPELLILMVPEQEHV